MTRGVASPGIGAGSAPRSLHVSKLRGIDLQTRARLKLSGIAYADQLLAVAGASAARRRLAERCRVEVDVLWRLVRRADLARINGIGAIFADMLELAGVDRVDVLARQEPTALHRRLVAVNGRERLARRAPTLEEVTGWVGQARTLPALVEP